MPERGDMPLPDTKNLAGAGEFLRLFANFFPYFRDWFRNI
jgi:hypothetical protein